MNPTLGGAIECVFVGSGLVVSVVALVYALANGYLLSTGIALLMVLYGVLTIRERMAVTG